MDQTGSGRIVNGIVVVPVTEEAATSKHGRKTSSSRHTEDWQSDEEEGRAMLASRGTA